MVAKWLQNGCETKSYMCTYIHIYIYIYILYIYYIYIYEITRLSYMYEIYMTTYILYTYNIYIYICIYIYKKR